MLEASQGDIAKVKDDFRRTVRDYFLKQEDGALQIMDDIARLLLARDSQIGEVYQRGVILARADKCLRLVGG